MIQSYGTYAKDISPVLVRVQNCPLRQCQKRNKKHFAVIPKAR
jgi:hypothetical protein